MALKSVIIQFETVADRDLWAKKLKQGLRRVFSSDPWIAGDFSADQIEIIRRSTKVEISPDVQLRPFRGLRGFFRAFR